MDKAARLVRMADLDMQYQPGFHSRHLDIIQDSKPSCIIWKGPGFHGWEVALRFFRAMGGEFIQYKGRSVVLVQCTSPEISDYYAYADQPDTVGNRIHCDFEGCRNLAAWILGRTNNMARCIDHRATFS